MSRYDCAFGDDNDCTVGYDVAMGTYFFMTGQEDHDGIPILWLGQRPEAHPRLADLEAALSHASQGPFVFPAELRAIVVASAMDEIVRDNFAGRINDSRALELLKAATAL